jgi:glutathione S-transferase
MSLTLYYHPLSSFCQKALIGIYELDIAVEKRFVDLYDEASRAPLFALWPMRKFPVLRDEARGLTIPESSVILEYLEGHEAARGRLIPEDRDEARECRLLDRVFDAYVNVPVGKIVTDKLRPEGERDPLGVGEARAQIERAYAIVEERMKGRTWAIGDAFTMADCAAAPALFYASKILPFGEGRPALGAYFERLTRRPSFARVLDEAAPYLAMFPG